MNFKEFLNESKETPTIEIKVDYFEDGEYEATFSTTEDVGALFKNVHNQLNKKITFFTPASRLLKMSFDKKEDFDEVLSALKTSGAKKFKTEGKNTTKFLKQLGVKNLNESKESYAVGDTVDLYTHTNGVNSGKYGTFNIEKVTNTMIYVYDHNTKETIKFNKNTLREIGPNSTLIIK